MQRQRDVLIVAAASAFASVVLSALVMHGGRTSGPGSTTPPRQEPRQELAEPPLPEEDSYDDSVYDDYNEQTNEQISQGLPPRVVDRATNVASHIKGLAKTLTSQGEASPRGLQAHLKHMQAIFFEGKTDKLYYTKHMDDTAFRDLIDVMLSELCDTEFRDLYPPGVLCPEHQEISTRFPHAEVLVDQVVNHKANGGNVAVGETMGELFLQSYFSAIVILKRKKARKYGRQPKTRAWRQGRREAEEFAKQDSQWFPNSYKRYEHLFPDDLDPSDF